MTMKKYDTVAPSNRNDSNAAINWHDGSIINKTSNTYIDYGHNTIWQRDVNWGVNPDKKLHEWPHCRIGGNNGRSHEANYEQNISGWARFIPMKFVYGFSIDFQQDNTSGHSLFLKNAGIEFVTEDGTYLRWGSNDRSRQSDTNRHTALYMFGADVQAEMAKNNAQFNRFICRTSSSGGSGTRETYVKLGNFRLIYDNTGCESGRWILPNRRAFTNRLNPDILPM